MRCSLLDIDECELFHNGQAGRLCLHTCVNTAGGYRCTCPAGYNVTRDGRSCKGVFFFSCVLLSVFILLILQICTQRYVKCSTSFCNTKCCWKQQQIHSSGLVSHCCITINYNSHKFNFTVIFNCKAHLIKNVSIYGSPEFEP